MIPIPPDLLWIPEGIYRDRTESEVKQEVVVANNANMLSAASSTERGEGSKQRQGGTVKCTTEHVGSSATVQGTGYSLYYRAEQANGGTHSAKDIFQRGTSGLHCNHCMEQDTEK